MEQLALPSQAGSLAADDLKLQNALEEENIEVLRFTWIQIIVRELLQGRSPHHNSIYGPCCQQARPQCRTF